MEIRFNPDDPNDIQKVAVFIAAMAHSGATPPAAPVTIAAPAMHGDEDDNGTVSTAAVDSRGTPYIPEVHSANRTVNKDGTWRRAKGVPKEAAEAAEMRARGQTAPAHLPPATVPFPTPAPAPVPTVISYDMLIEKLADVQKKTGEAITAVEWANMLSIAGISSNDQLQTNESARGVVYNALHSFGMNNAK